jgi:PhnB protein
MNLNASVTLHFNGDCEAAFKFYEHLLGGKIEFVLPWGASPLADQAPAGWGQKILFARLTSRDMTLLGGDALPGQYRPAAGFSLTLSTADPGEAEYLATELAKDGGSVTVPLEKTFWALRYGVVTDRFGIPWEINCAKAH